MTPARLTELHCPACAQITWVIDSDYRGRGGPDAGYGDRSYSCASCGQRGAGWTVGQQSPPEFLLQPHDLYPMTQPAFDYWVNILRIHFPTNWRLQELGQTFRPRLPEEAEALREAHGQAHPVCEMTDQDGARRVDPDLDTAAVWFDIMKPGDTLQFRRRDGGTLRCELLGAALSVQCRNVHDQLLAEATAAPPEVALEAIRAYLLGDVTACAAVASGSYRLAP